MMVLEKIINYGMMTALGLLSIIISLEVFSRYFFQLPLPWSTDVNRFLFVYLIYLGAVAGVREKAHLSIDIFTEKLPKRTRQVWEIVINILIILFLLGLVYGGISFALGTTRQVTPYLRVSISYYYLVIPLSAVIMIYYFLFHIKNQLDYLGQVSKTAEK